MEAPGQVNEQGQLPARGRGGRGGVRVRGGGIGGRGRGARRHCAVPDEIRATVIDHENLWPHRLQRVDGQEGEDGVNTQTHTFVEPYLLIIGLIAHAGEAKFGCVYEEGVYASVTD
ncbi:hypothetical protein QQF64_010604 [Cirrhinus molitorella]|uniref:Uncharacterized protein n=1 Tax=Cirrhinus molitorella TaxID=172907 RepID=A0ABR3LWV5_9TELE